MKIPTEAELVEKIEAFCGRQDMAPTRFGREATGNPNLLKEIRDGRSPSLRTVQRVLAFMAALDAEQIAAEASLNGCADAARNAFSNDCPQQSLRKAS